jgi:hypothetical protein
MRLEWLEDRTVPSQLSFPGPQILNTPLTSGEAPTGIIAASLTTSGLKDLIYTQGGPGNTGTSVVVALQNPDGTFQPGIVSTAGNGAGALIAGDFNGDTMTDVAVANYADNTVSVLLGQGNGFFQNPITLTTGSHPDAIVAGDFNGDGKLDLAVANFSSNTVSVFLGNGDGTFHTTVNYAVGSNPAALVVGDFNGDGKLDLATANANGGGAGSVSVLMGNGNGTFQPAVSYSSGGSNAVALTSGTYDGTSTLDLAVANQASGTVEILHNNGSGVFTAASGFSMTGVSSLATADINHDNLPDIVASAYQGGNGTTVAVSLNQGGGAFGQPVFTNTGGQGISGIAAFNGSSGIEVATANQGSLTISVLQSNSDGTFVSAPQASLGNAAVAPNAMAMADFNGDGKPDIVTANASSGNITVALGNGAGGFSTPVSYSTGNPNSTPMSVAVADLGNGHLDIITANFGQASSSTPPSYSVFLGNGDGTFQPAITTNVSDPVALVVGDFNGDGKKDIALAGQDGMITILLGNGNGTFAAPITFSSGATGLSSLAAADFNGDGKLDLVTTVYNGGAGSTVNILYGNGDGTFQAPVSVNVGQAPVYVAAADLNGDGLPDLVVAEDAPSNTVAVLLNNGGTLSSRITYPINGLVPRSVTVADMNQDGIPDLVVTNEASQNVTVLLGNGDGTFGTYQTFAVGGTGTNYQNPNPIAAVVGDFNGDGTPDIVTADSGTNSLSLLLSQNPSAVTTTTITAPAVTYGTNGSVTVTVSAGTGTPTGSVSLSVDGGAAVTQTLVNGAATFNVGVLNGGNHALAATYTPIGSFRTSSATGTLVVNPASQTITFGALANVTYGVAPFTVSATASSGLPVSFAIVSGPASINGNTITILGTGTVTVEASQSGNGNYSAAPVVDRSFTVISSGPASGSIYVLNPTANGAMSTSGNGAIHIPGTIYVDSSSSSAVSASGSASVAAVNIDVVGGVVRSGSASFSVAPTTGSSSVPDPLAGITAPSITGLTNYGAVNLSGTSSATISQGIYSAINVSGNASLTLTPGIYIIEGGGFTVTGNASICGHGVLIFNTSSNYPSTMSPGNFGGITISGSGTINLTAATTGPYTGVVIYQARNNTRAVSLGGNGLVGVQGTIYAANALLTMSGNAQLQATLVVGTLNVSGNVSLSQIATGSDGGGDIVGIADTLVAGNLEVYVNDPSGYFTADMLARIQDAITGWDAVLQPYSVTITEVSDPSLANLVIDDGTTSASGTAAGGVLGCYNPANSEITILQGWSWYAGADPSQIAAGQYDFQTTISHELGHALGLGGSSSLTSPMNEILPTGTARRGMTAADLNIPYPPQGADPLTAAGYGEVQQSSLVATVPSTVMSLPLNQASAGATVTMTSAPSTATMGANSLTSTIGRAFGQIPGTSADVALINAWRAGTIVAAPISQDVLLDPQSSQEPPAIPSDAQPAQPQSDPSGSAKTGAARPGVAAQQSSVASEALNADAIDAIFSGGWDDGAWQHPLAEVAIDSEPVALAVLGLYFGMEAGEAEKQENGRKFQR